MDLYINITKENQESLKVKQNNMLIIVGEEAANQETILTLANSSFLTFGK